MSIFEVSIGWLAPTQCVVCGSEGHSLCQMCEAADILPYGEHCGLCGAVSINSQTCDRCRRAGAPKHIWITTDYENAAQKLLQAYKFGHQRAAAGSIARLMSQTFEYFNPDSGVQDYLIVPVPTASSRVRARSFDHSYLIAKKLSGFLGLPCQPALTRFGQSRQVGAKRQARLLQQQGNYIAQRPQVVKGRRVLIIDDVVTTGATLKAVYKTLRQAGAKQVDALVFAKRL